MNEDVVRTVNLHKHFGKTKALAGLSINITEQSITGLVGRNGSGKTTLLKILAGILDKTSGELQVFGAEPMDNLPVLNRLIYAYHNMSYHSSFIESSQKLDTILAAYKTMFTNFDEVFAYKLLKYFELNSKTRYSYLSQGMSSTFNFICALSCRADLTMLDEPVLGMDVTVRKSVYEILLRDFSEHPRTFIISSHLLSEIEGLLSDVLLIEKGKAVLHGPISDIQQSAYRVDGSHKAVQSFIVGKRTIAKRISDVSSFAVIYEPLSNSVSESVSSQGLTVSPVRAEDLCMYLTLQDKEDELACLW